MHDSKKRSLVKGLSWRILATMDTFFIAYFFFGEIHLALPIAITEVFSKILLYYLHERGWDNISWGRESHMPSHLRSIAKGATWRFIGSLDTIIISFAYSGNMSASFSVGLTEVATKISFFYIH